VSLSEYSTSFAECGVDERSVVVALHSSGESGCDVGKRILHSGKQHQASAEAGGKRKGVGDRRLLFNMLHKMRLDNPHSFDFMSISMV